MFLGCITVLNQSTAPLYFQSNINIILLVLAATPKMEILLHSDTIFPISSSYCILLVSHAFILEACNFHLHLMSLLLWGFFVCLFVFLILSIAVLWNHCTNK